MKKIPQVRLLMTLMLIITFAAGTAAGAGLYGVPAHQKNTAKNLQASENSESNLKKSPHRFQREKGKHNKSGGHYLSYGKNNRRPIIIVREREYVPEPVPTKEVVVKKRYIPVIRQVAPLRCSGDTAYYRNPQTGEIVINYITSAKRC